MIVDTDNIVSANEIAERLGLSFPNVVHAWQQRHESFPQPVMVFKSCKLW